MIERRGREIADGVFQLPSDYPEVLDGPLWVYAVRDGATALVDSALPSTFDAILGAELHRLAIDPAAIDQVLLTHGHFDHLGGARRMKALSRATIAAPIDDAAWIEDPERQWRELWDGYPGAARIPELRDLFVGFCGGGVRIDRPLRDGDVVTVGNRELQAVQTRGHSRGHVAFLDSRTGCLFSGDAIGGRGVPASSGRQTYSPMYEDVEDYRASLRRMREIPFDLLCPSHAEPLPAPAARSLIDESLAFVDQVDALVRDMVASAREPVPTRLIAGRIGEMVGSEPVTNLQTVTVAVAHLNELARAGIIEESWGPVIAGRRPGRIGTHAVHE